MYIKGIGLCIAEIWPFEVFKMDASRHLGFCPTGNSAVLSAIAETPP